MQWESSLMTLRGRVGIVTGADSDAGRRAVAALAADGMSLMLLASPGARLHDLAEDVARQHSVTCMAASVDVTDPSAVDRVLMHVEQHLGPIDVVVSTVPGALVEAVLPTMAARGRGHVVHMPPSKPDDVAPPEVTVIMLEAEGVDAVAERLKGPSGSPDPPG